MNELIKRVNDGEIEAFRELFLIIYNELFKISMARLSNVEDTEDAIQDTMIEIHKHLKKVRDFDKTKQWIIKILINKCNKIYKKRIKKDLFVEEDLENILSCNDLEKIEDNMSFYYLIKDLKYEEKIITILFYMEGYSIKQIKNILKMKENTISTHLHRARIKIKDKIEEENKSGIIR